MPTAVLVGWLALFGAALALLTLVGSVAFWQHRRERPRLRATERAELARHAAAVAASADQAARRVAAALERAELAGRARADAWHSLEQAQRAYEEASRAHQANERQRAAQPADESGQREVGRAALAAYRRGDLSQEQLFRVWRWSSGWDPEQERLEHQLTELRAAQRDAYLRYRAVSAKERAAVRDAEIAEVAARALSVEAAEAEQAAAPP